METLAGAKKGADGSRKIDGGDPHELIR